MSENKDVVEERVYTVPLDHAWIAPIKKRAPRAMKILREYVKKNMDVESILISSEVNEELWKKGIEGPPRKIRIRAVKDKENTVRVNLVEGE